MFTYTLKYYIIFLLLFSCKAKVSSDKVSTQGENSSTQNTTEVEQQTTEETSSTTEDSSGNENPVSPPAIDPSYFTYHWVAENLYPGPYAQVSPDTGDIYFAGVIWGATNFGDATTPNMISPNYSTTENFVRRFDRHGAPIAHFTYGGPDDWNGRYWFGFGIPTTGGYISGSPICHPENDLADVDPTPGVLQPRDLPGAPASWATQTYTVDCLPTFVRVDANNDFLGAQMFM